MFGTFFKDIETARTLWKKVYQEKAENFHQQFTKIFEVAAVSCALITGIATSFLLSSGDNTALIIVSSGAFVSAFISFTTSIILIVMVNSTENRNVIRFLDEWYQYSYVPLVGLIMSFLLNFVSLLLFIPTRVTIYITPAVSLITIAQLIFHSRIRKSVLKYGSEELSIV